MLNTVTLSEQAFSKLLKRKRMGERVEVKNAKVKRFHYPHPFYPCYDSRQSLNVIYPTAAPVVQKVNSAIHRINLYPVGNATGFTNTYPLDTDLSQIYPMNSAIQLLNNWGLVDNSIPLLCFLYFLRHVTDHCCQG